MRVGRTPWGVSQTLPGKNLRTGYSRAVSSIFYAIEILYALCMIIARENRFQTTLSAC